MGGQARGLPIELPAYGRPSEARVRPARVASPGWSAGLTPRLVARVIDVARTVRVPGQGNESKLRDAEGRGRDPGRRSRAGRGAGSAQPSPRERASAPQRERQEARGAAPKCAGVAGSKNPMNEPAG